MSGGDLLSHKVPLAVPSTLRGLASGFGMGPGVSLSLWPPKLFRVGRTSFKHVSCSTGLLYVVFSSRP